MGTQRLEDLYFFGHFLRRGFFLHCGFAFGTHCNAVCCRQVIVAEFVVADCGVCKWLVVSVLGVSLGSGFGEANSEGPLGRVSFCSEQCM